MMDWTIHPDGGMWVGCKDFVHVSHASIWRDMLNGMWVGYMAVDRAKNVWFRSMDFGEVITELESTIILLEAS